MAGGIGAISKLVTNSSAPSAASAADSAGGTSIGSSIKSTVSNISGSLVSASPASLGELGNGLSATALPGLNKSQIAGLSSAIQSIGSGGPQTIKMPTVATNTIDRSDINSQTKSLFGDSRIPMPTTGNFNFKPPSPELQQKYDAIKAELEAKQDARWTLSKDLSDAKRKYGLDSYQVESADVQYKECVQRIAELQAEKTAVSNQILASL